MGDVFCISIETLKPKGHALADLQVFRKDLGHIDLRLDLISDLTCVSLKREKEGRPAMKRLALYSHPSDWLYVGPVSHAFLVVQSNSLRLSD